MQLPLVVLFTILGLFTHLIFLFQREWFDHPARLRAAVAVGVVLFATALGLEHAGGHTKNDFFLLLKMPLLSLACYKAMQWGFVRLVGYRPRDSFYTIDLRLMKDGLFNFLFWVLGTVVPIALIFGRVL